MKRNPLAPALPLSPAPAPGPERAALFPPRIGGPRPLVAVLALALLASCGEGGGDLPTVTQLGVGTAALWVEAPPADGAEAEGAAAIEAETETEAETGAETADAAAAGGEGDAGTATAAETPPYGAAGQAGEADGDAAPAAEAQYGAAPTGEAGVRETGTGETVAGEAGAGEAGAGEAVDGEAGAGEASAPADGETNLAALPPPPQHDPEELMGLNRGQVTVMLGAPNLVRRDAPAEVWQYLGRDCILDVFLYRKIPDPPTGPILPKPKPRPEERRRRAAAADPAANPGAKSADGVYLVSYYETRPRGAGPVSDRGCLNELVGGRRDGEAG